MSEHWFEYRGERYDMFFHLYNLTGLNERQVEIAIAQRWLGRQEGRGLEVGNVLGHYWHCTHAVWDLHEQRAWYQTDQPYANVDILDPYDSLAMFEYDWVVSLSTVEHTADPAKAIGRIYACAPVGLVSFPTGVDATLDSWLEHGAPGDYVVHVLSRVDNDHGGWEQSPTLKVEPYGPWANAVAVLEWDRR